MYLNTLICLEENVTGYGKNGAKATGHIIITSPGIVKCYVQNLRQLPKEYTVYLISKNQNRAARLGCMNVCDGNRQMTWKIDLNNIKGTGLKGTDIDSGAIIVEGDSIGNTDTILIGYTQGKYLITSMLESALPKKVAPIANEAEKCASEPKLEVKPAAKPEPKLEVKPAAKPEPKPEVKPEVKPAAKPEPKPEVKPVAKPELKSEPKPIPQPVQEVTPTPVPKIVPKVEPKIKVVMPEQEEMPAPGIITEPGPGPVIIPKPEKCEPAPITKPEKKEYECHVITPVQDEEEPGTFIIPKVKKKSEPEPVILPAMEEHGKDKCQDQEKAKNKNEDECECKVYVPTSEEGDVTEVEILRGLEGAFARTPNKEDLAKKVEGIIHSSIKPVQVPPQMRPVANKVNKEEEQYLSQIESVLKSIQNNIGEELKEKKTILEDEVSDYKRDIARVRDIFNDSSAIEPFEEKDPHIDWVRISMAELISMPQLSYEWCTNPVITYCYHKFGFLILGRDKDIEQYYVGIPDIYDAKRKFILSMDKVEAFRGRSNEDLKPGDYGYWIVRV